MLSETVKTAVAVEFNMCLNPCFNGICSLRMGNKVLEKNQESSLNPCFNGICSLSTRKMTDLATGEIVLILVLMEYAL